MPPASLKRGPNQILAETIGLAGPADLDFTSYIQAAQAEIQAVPPAAIHRESALRWSARAVASYRICADSQVQDDRLCYMYLGEQYREAALAHAAMGEPWEPLYTAINDIMQLDRAKAFDEAHAAGTQLKRPKARHRTKKTG